MKLTIDDTLNAQINTELWSAYLFLSMSVNAGSKGYKGVADWFYARYQKEQTDAKKIIDYLKTIDSKVYFYPIEIVPTDWDSLLDIFNHKLEHDRKIYKLLHTAATFAEENKDYVSLDFLTMLAKEQLQEEAATKELLQAFEAAEDNKYALYMLDKELQRDTFLPHSAV